jgi:hypothetical protein
MIYGLCAGMLWAVRVRPLFPKPKVACSSQAGTANNFNNLLKIIRLPILFLFSQKMAAKMRQGARIVLKSKED